MSLRMHHRDMYALVFFAVHFYSEYCANLCAANITRSAVLIAEKELFCDEVELAVIFRLLRVFFRPNRGTNFIHTGQ